jgi:hypothetical protein
MLQALLCAAATGGALVIGAGLGCFRTPPKQLTAGALADSVMPEAYPEGGPLVAFATSGGFLVAYALTTLD